MKVVNYDEFWSLKKAFLEKHDNDYEVETFPMMSDGSYRKIYKCSDTSIWFEVMRPVWENAEVEIKKTHINVEVKLLETEAWNTDDSVSIYYYEKY